MLQGIRWPMQTYEERTIVDEIVKQAMTKWPDVPDCFGWLGLDNRGQWHMRDDRVQALGSFQSGLQGAKGSVLRHEKLISFIDRNYDRAKKLIEENMDILHAMKDALMKYETIDAKQIDDLMARREVRQPENWEPRDKPGSDDKPDAQASKDETVAAGKPSEGNLH